MNIVTKKMIIANVAAAWRASYFNDNGKWFPLLTFPKKGCIEVSSGYIYKRLLRAKTEKAVTKIIGNNSWTANECQECDVDSESVLQFGDGAGRFRVCFDCLEKAINMFFINNFKEKK